MFTPVIKTDDVIIKLLQNVIEPQAMFPRPGASVPVQVQDHRFATCKTILIPFSVEKIKKIKIILYLFQYYIVVCCFKVNDTGVLLKVLIQNKLAYVQVITNCQYSAAEMCTWEVCLPTKQAPSLTSCVKMSSQQPHNNV